jgi:hypothetical protein
MWNKLMRGAAGGLAGTLAHSAVMLTGRALGLGGKLPPKAITDELVESLGVDPSESTRVALAVANHVGMGVTTGALFGLVQPRMSRGKSMLTGAAYGVAVYLASYEGWVPHVLGALPRAHRDRWDRHAYLLAAHIAFGAVLGAVTARPPEPVHDDYVDPSNIDLHADRATQRRQYASEPLAEPPITES